MRKTFSRFVCDTCGKEVEMMGTWQYAEAILLGKESSRMRGWWHLEQMGQPAQETPERADFCSWACLAAFTAKRATG